MRKTSHAVAERFQLKDRGYIREGYWADLVVIDPFSHQQIIREDVAYKCGWSPFEGRILSGGAVDMTLVNGQRYLEWAHHTAEVRPATGILSLATYLFCSGITSPREFRRGKSCEYYYSWFFPGTTTAPFSHPFFQSPSGR
ncbi:hypothetical protein V6S19_07240 [Klebsiella pneumoniae]